VGSITGYFQSETPLHPAAQAFLTDAFAQGWADPAKIHHDSRKAGLLLNEAKELIAIHLGIGRDQVEFVADPTMGFQMGISGLLHSEAKLYYSATDRSELFALASQVPSVHLPVGIDGLCQYPRAAATDVLAWQSANGETGVVSDSPKNFQGLVFVDATRSGPLVPLPDRWHTALWNSRAWQGPAGLGIFAISDHSVWRNPFPHIDHQITSADLSIPLAISSAIALDNFAREYQESEIFFAAQNAKIRHFLLTQIGDVDLAGELDSTLAHLLSFSLLYVDAGLLMSRLNDRGIFIDSGSACNSSNMEPSHVLAAMGLLTHGNVRISLHLGVSEESIDRFLIVLKELVLEIRA
jgi:cysteine desulfurase